MARVTVGQRLVRVPRHDARGDHQSQTRDDLKRVIVSPASIAGAILGGIFTYSIDAPLEYPEQVAITICSLVFVLAASFFAGTLYSLSEILRRLRG
jgi:hypothetical protein